MQLYPDGSIDRGFGNDGAVRIDFGSRASSYPESTSSAMTGS